MHHQQLPFADDREKLRRSRIYGTAEFWQVYQNYVHSVQWKKLCTRVRQRAAGRCERCNDVALKPLEVHHITYERFQEEPLTDLQALCQPCHRMADIERERRNQQKYDDACDEGRYNAARNTYFTKKLGEDWVLDYCADPEGLSEEFNSWLEQKREAEY
jgi:HNH endonuclease